MKALEELYSPCRSSLNKEDRLDKSHKRKALIQAIVDQLHRASSIADRERILNSFRQELRVCSTIHTEEKEVATLLLMWAEVQEMEELDGSDLVLTQ